MKNEDFKDSYFNSSIVPHTLKRNTEISYDPFKTNGKKNI
jgi:hypothetical protein